MSEEAVKDPGVEPGKQVTNWDEEMAKYAQKAAASERPQLAAISLRGGFMKYNDVAIPGNKLQTIVIASVMERVFYEERFDPNKPASPSCFAFHDGTDGVEWMPNEKSALNKSPTGCAYCQYSQWGSDPHNPGSRGKGCKEKRKLVLMPNPKSKEMALLSVPVMSVRNWSNYVNGIAASFQRPPWGMLTEISVRPDPKSQFVVEFEPVEPLPQDMLASVFDKIELATQILTTPYDYHNPQENLGQPNNGPKKEAKPKKY